MAKFVENEDEARKRLDLQYPKSTQCPESSWRLADRNLRNGGFSGSAIGIQTSCRESWAGLHFRIYDLNAKAKRRKDAGRVPRSVIGIRDQRLKIILLNNWNIYFSVAF